MNRSEQVIMKGSLKKDSFELDFKARERFLDGIASRLVESWGVDGERAHVIAKIRVSELYAEAYLNHSLGDDWKEYFNTNHGKSSSDLMIEHLGQAYINRDKKDLNQIVKYLTDNTLCNEQPHVIYGLLGSSKDSDARQTFVASRSTTSVRLEKIGKELTRVAYASAFALFVAVVLPHVLVGTAAMGTVHLIGSPVIERGLKLSETLIKLDQMENKELKTLEDWKQTMIAPLGKKYRGPAPRDQAERDKRGNDSFNEMRTAVQSMEWGSANRLLV